LTAVGNASIVVPEQVLSALASFDIRPPDVVVPIAFTDSSVTVRGAPIVLTDLYVLVNQSRLNISLPGLNGSAAIFTASLCE
jgi:hypothetical protein